MTDNIHEDYRTVHDYIKSAAAATLKPPRHPLKYPFIDPGSVYDGNLWDWDSYWALYGLTGIADSLPENWLEYGKGNVLNFLDHQLEDGYIPMLIEVNENQSMPWLNRQHLNGKIMNMHKPFLCRQALLVSDHIRDYSWLKPYIPRFRRYFDCYDRFYLHARTGLFVWADDIMIGMDNDPASFGRPPRSTANIFLNSFMIKEFEAMAVICRELGLKEDEKHFSIRAQNLAKAVQTECWDDRDGFFYSVDVDVETRPYEWIHKGLGVFWNSLPIRIQVWSGFLPLWAGIATPEQAEIMRNHYRNPKSFNANGGIRTLSREEKMYNLDATNNPSNWLGPVWIVASYCVFRGLLNYDFAEESAELTAKTLSLLAKDIRKTGTLHEYYNPETCLPVMNGGFINWNILVLNMAREINIQGTS